LVVAKSSDTVSGLVLLLLPQPQSDNKKIGKIAILRILIIILKI
jgi:hypothetical protein